MRLYKYTTITEYTKTNLKKNQLYLQSPVKFNDPYEFIFRFEVEDDIYLGFLKLIYGDKYTEFLKRDIPKEQVLSHTRDYYFSEAWKLMGATCLTENKADDLMWAHYGGNHKGMH